jgi:hypothetical protein
MKNLFISNFQPESQIGIVFFNVQEVKTRKNKGKCWSMSSSLPFHEFSLLITYICLHGLKVDDKSKECLESDAPIAPAFRAFMEKVKAK